MAVINGYTLIEPPIQGGMALVYKGQKGAFTRAFKMVRPDKAANNSKLCQTFLKEIHLQSKLQHGNIINILDAYPFTDPSTHITVTVLEMEWLNGMDLQRYVEQKYPQGIDSQSVKQIALQVIDGLECAHKHNILHLDIKPSNIFRTQDGFIKIIDFGIARVVGENAEIVDGASKVTIMTETGESTFKGTLAYASPEQQVGAKLSFTSDIYSFGKTLHFLCTGSTDPAVDVKDTLLNEIVNKCTIQNPKLRYQSFSEVRNAFSAPKQQIRCKACNSLIDKYAKFCPNCGTKVTTGPDYRATKRCPQCGKIHSVSNNFCDACGYNFNNQNQSPKQITGYYCRKCKQTTKAYSDGNVKFCNHCGASKEFLMAWYK